LRRPARAGYRISRIQGGNNMTQPTAHPIRAAWAAGRPARNAWLTIPDAQLAEIVAASGVGETVTLDLQHGLFDQGSAVHCLRAVACHGRAALVRLPAIDAAVIGYLLDAGAAGVIAPMVETVAEAEALVQAVRFPPRGRRSHGPTRAGLGGADVFRAAEAAVLFAMIETRAGLECCEDLAAVDSLDGLFIGPGDLGLSLGLGPGQDRTEPELEAAFARVLAACRAAGKRAAIHAATTAYAAAMAARGFDLVTVWVDADAVAATLAAADGTWQETKGGQRNSNA
jgi:4-hydroxy-2-oxoheptanedioate aldolase